MIEPIIRHSETLIVQNLTASALHCPWQQYLFKLVEATLTHKFDKCAGAEVHAELSRVLPSHTFVLAADEGNSQEHHHKYEQAILRLGGLTAAQEVRHSADYSAGCLTAWLTTRLTASCLTIGCLTGWLTAG